MAYRFMTKLDYGFGNFRMIFERECGHGPASENIIFFEQFDDTRRACFYTVKIVALVRIVTDGRFDMDAQLVDGLGVVVV